MRHYRKLAKNIEIIDFLVYELMLQKFGIVDERKLHIAVLILVWGFKRKRLTSLYYCKLAGESFDPVRLLISAKYSANPIYELCRENIRNLRRAIDVIVSSFPCSR